MGAYKVFYTGASRTDIGAGSGVKPAASGGGRWEKRPSNAIREIAATAPVDPALMQEAK